MEKTLCFYCVQYLAVKKEVSANIASQTLPPHDLPYICCFGFTKSDQIAKAPRRVTRKAEGNLFWIVLWSTKHGRHHTLAGQGESLHRLQLSWGKNQLPNQPWLVSCGCAVQTALLCRAAEEQVERMCLKNASTMALPHSYRAHKNHTLSGCISYATSAISPAHCLSLQWSHLRLQISQELYVATPWQYTLAFSLSVCMFSSFSLSFTFYLTFISFFFTVGH